MRSALVNSRTACASANVPLATVASGEGGEGGTSRKETDERCCSRCDQHDKNERGSPPERYRGNDDTDETCIDRD